MRLPSRRHLGAVATALTFTCAACPAASAAEAHRGGPFAFDTAHVAAFGGEPSMAVGPTGELYDTSPSHGTTVFRSLDHGESWAKTPATPDPSSGDDCVATDQSGSLYVCNLAGSPSTAPLQADSWKSADDGRTWIYGQNPINQNPAGVNACGTSCNPFGVDRDWEDAYIPRGGTTNSANVVLMYHDFYGPSSIWVNVSHDGGKTFGPTTNVIANMTPSAAAQATEAEIYSSCSTVPIGADFAKSGPHAGRIYVAWLASDPESAATGCNLSQAQAFHTLFVAWSDDGGATWTPQLAYDAGLGHDASTPFAAFTLDRQGNPYIAITTQPQNENPEVCAAESAAGTEGSDPTCAYHTWVFWSADGGSIWDGGGGTIPGSAAQAYQVDPGTKPQTDVFPAIAAGDPGKVDVAWLGTNETEPTGPLGKFNPGGCAGPSTAGVPTYPPPCQWKLFGAQSLNLYAPVGDAKFTTTTITPTPMHIGDICNLGIACVPGVSNRNLLDFISETVDPTTGLAHIAYADDNKGNDLRAANQISGPTILTPRPHHHG